MRLTDILQDNCVKVHLTSTDKQQAIFELTELLAEHVDLGDLDELKQAVWARESTRTTGIGHGIGIPHGKCRGCKQLCMAVGLCAEPIDFGAIDEKPVQIILLIVSPLDQIGPHIQALAGISRMLTDDVRRDQIKTAPDAATLYQLIEQYDTQSASVPS